MNSLTMEQLKAIESFKEHALKYKEDSTATIRHILKMSNISEEQYLHALRKLKSHSRVAIHFHPDRYDEGGKLVANSLLNSGVYKNQFETKISNGSVSAHPGGQRDEWERVLYNGAYHSGGFLDSCRPKYGALDLFHHPDGPAPRFGSCYFILKNEILNRSTFTYLDSHQLPSERGTLEEFDSILCSLLTEIFIRNYALGEHQLSVSKFFDFLLNKIDNPQENYEREIPRINLDHYIEAQIHGEISLQNDVECLIADPSFIGTNIEKVFNDICERYNIKLHWHSGFALSLDEIPLDFRGAKMPELAKQITAKSFLSTEAIGFATQELKNNSSKFSHRGSSAEVLQELKYLWHVLVTFGKPLRNFKNY